jgi:hypothetical protein
MRSVDQLMRSINPCTCQRMTSERELIVTLLSSVKVEQDQSPTVTETKLIKGVVAIDDPVCPDFSKVKRQARHKGEPL